MKVELKFGLLFTALSLIINQINILPDFAAGFLAGLLTVGGIFFIIVSMLPERVYNNLAYRKLLNMKK